MSDGYQAWWIDDVEANSRAADELEGQRSDLNVEFQTPDRLDAFETSPDLVLVDWFLDQEGFSNYDRGISVEAKIREDHPNVPIYGFSGEIEERNEEQFSRERFDHGIFERSDLSEPDAADLLVQDIKDYKAIRDVEANEFDTLLDILEVPEDDHANLKSVIPREYSTGFKSPEDERPGERLKFARWVRTRFLATPGPLLNETWAATQLGMTKDGFRMNREKFEHIDLPGDLEYTGIFNHRVEDRFWESQLMRGLAKLEKDADINLSSRETCRLGVAVLDVDEEHQSECVVCRDRFPQTVAAREGGEPAKYPVHYRHSNVHHSREGAFKDYRELARDTE